MKNLNLILLEAFLNHETFLLIIFSIFILLNRRVVKSSQALDHNRESFFLQPVYFHYLLLTIVFKLCHNFIIEKQNVTYLLTAGKLPDSDKRKDCKNTF